jgi:hypothetical protein
MDKKTRNEIFVFMVLEFYAFIIRTIQMLKG